MTDKASDADTASEVTQEPDPFIQDLLRVFNTICDDPSARLPGDGPSILRNDFRHFAVRRKLYPDDKP